MNDWPKCNFKLSWNILMTCRFKFEQLLALGMTLHESHIPVYLHIYILVLTLNHLQ